MSAKYSKIIVNETQIFYPDERFSAKLTSFYHVQLVTFETWC